jgi:TetR/AcrR family transcriptional regulator, fatty acid metabolism regulator protein
LPSFDREVYDLTMRSESRSNSPSFTESARRSQIVRCAVDALAEAGYSGASLAEIARRAGVSKGVVLYYFSGKDDLLEHVFIDVYSRAGSAIAAQLSAAGDAAAAVSGYLNANLRFLRENPADVRAVIEIAANARRSDGALKFGPHGEDPVLDHFEALLVEGQRSADFGDFDTRSLAIIVRGAIDTASGRLIADPSFDIDAYTAELVRVVELAVTRRDQEDTT